TAGRAGERKRERDGAVERTRQHEDLRGLGGGLSQKRASPALGFREGGRRVVDAVGGRPRGFSPRSGGASPTGIEQAAVSRRSVAAAQDAADAHGKGVAG